MIGNLFAILLLLLPIFHLTDQIIELTDENGIQKLISSDFVLKQCYGSMGESSPGSYRIQFRVEGKGHCQLLLCYPSQLDPNAMHNGMAPEIGFHLANNLETNPWVNKCPIEQGEIWHGIYIDVDVDNVNLNLSFNSYSFPINQRNFILDLANSSHPSITTKLFIYNQDLEKFELKEFDDQIRQQFLGNQHRGAHLVDSAGFWPLSFDILPSNLNEQKIRMLTFASENNEHDKGHDTCDMDSGEMIKGKCNIRAWFLEPVDQNLEVPNQNAENQNITNNSTIMNLTLPFTDILNSSLKKDDIIHITGLLNKNEGKNFKIHLLHNWSEPNSIMGETILIVDVRRNYINFYSIYNFTKYEQPNSETILDKIDQNLENNLDQKFSLDIRVEENGNYNVSLNCLKDKAFKFKQSINMPSNISIDYIWIEADSGWELYRYKIISKPISPSIISKFNNATDEPFYDPSYSLELNYSNPFEKDIYVIVNLELRKNAKKFDINLVQYDKERNEGAIVARFHVNLIENFYQVGRCNKECTDWTEKVFINASNINKLLPAAGDGQEFLFYFVQSIGADLILINQIGVGELPTIGRPNYIQFKGDLLLHEWTIEEDFAFEHEYPLESAFTSFNQIKIIFKILLNKEYKIIFGCSNGKYCEKSNISMELVINENDIYLVYNNKSIDNQINLPENRKLELSIYASQFEYVIFGGSGRILSANYSQFPTPDKFDTIKIRGLILLPEPRKEWENPNGNIDTTNLSAIEQFAQDYPLESTLDPFNQITFTLKLLQNITRCKIIFHCMNGKGCAKSLNISMELDISEHDLSLIYKNQSLTNKTKLLENRTLQIRIDTSLIEYEIYIGDESKIMANYSQFPTPNEFDTITIQGLIFLMNGKPRLNVAAIEKIDHDYPLESAFNPFNQITFFLKLLPNEIIKIIFHCLDERKCNKSLNILMELSIGEKNVTLVYNETSISNNITLPLNQILNLRIYANQYEYQIFNGDERILMADYWEFPTPDKFDTIKIQGVFFLLEAKPKKEWKQFDSDITLPLSYRLDKRLEIGSTINIKMKIPNTNDWNITIYLQHDASKYNQHFGKNVLWLSLYTQNITDRFYFDYGRMDSNGMVENFTTESLENFIFAGIFELEIIVQKEEYQILIDGMELFKFKHILSIEMVDLLRIEEEKLTKGKIIEAKITWPSDSLEKWLTAPEQKQIELSGPLGMPTRENLIMRLGRPLRINDVIIFKGKFHNGFKEIRDLFIDLSRDLPNHKTFRILRANLEYRPKSDDSKSTIFYLLKDQYDKDGKLKYEKIETRLPFSPSNDEFDVKIRIGADNKFYVQNGNSTEASMNNDGLFWAVQYIKFFYYTGLEKSKQNVELYKGYPKIVHQYEKEKDEGNI